MLYRIAAVPAAPRTTGPLFQNILVLTRRAVDCSGTTGMGFLRRLSQEDAAVRALVAFALEGERLALSRLFKHARNAAGEALCQERIQSMLLSYALDNTTRGRPCVLVCASARARRRVLDSVVATLRRCAPAVPVAYPSESSGSWEAVAERGGERRRMERLARRLWVSLCPDCQESQREAANNVGSALRVASAEKPGLVVIVDGADEDVFLALTSDTACARARLGAVRLIAGVREVPRGASQQFLLCTNEEDEVVQCDEARSFDGHLTAPALRSTAYGLSLEDLAALGEDALSPTLTAGLREIGTGRFFLARTECHLEFAKWALEESMRGEVALERRLRLRDDAMLCATRCLSIDKAATDVLLRCTTDKLALGEWIRDVGSDDELCARWADVGDRDAVERSLPQTRRAGELLSLAGHFKAARSVLDTAAARSEKSSTEYAFAILGVARNEIRYWDSRRDWGSPLDLSLLMDASQHAVTALKKIDSDSVEYYQAVTDRANAHFKAGCVSSPEKAKYHYELANQLADDVVMRLGEHSPVWRRRKVAAGALLVKGVTRMCEAHAAEAMHESGSTEAALDALHLFYQAELRLHDVVGPFSELSIFTHGNLGECYLHAFGLLALGLVHERRACLVALKVFGPSHPNAARKVVEFASTLTHLGATELSHLALNRRFNRLTNRRLFTAFHDFDTRSAPRPAFHGFRSITSLNQPTQALTFRQLRAFLTNHVPDIFWTDLLDDDDLHPLLLTQSLDEQRFDLSEPLLVNR